MSTEKGYLTKNEIEEVSYQRNRLLPASNLQKNIMDTFRLTEEFKKSYGECLFEMDENRKSIQTAIKYIKKCKHLDAVDKQKNRDLIIDMLYSKYILGFNYYEYFLFNFENLSIKDRLEFLSENKRDLYYAKINNNKEANNKLNNKYLTFQLLKEFYGRDVISVDGEEDVDIFLSFAKNHQKFIVKPIGNYGGKGVVWAEHNEVSKPNEVFNSLLEKYKRFICEEPVIAPDYMKKIYPNAINTVRIVTYNNGEGEINIIGAMLRVGRNGLCVDNFSSGGIVAGIDIDTGIVNSDGVDKENYRYDKHPDTKVEFKGFAIENWDELIYLAQKVAYAMPEVPLIGWDFAASKSGNWQIIEANVRPWIEVHQSFGPKGFRRKFEKDTQWKKRGI